MHSHHQSWRCSASPGVRLGPLYMTLRLFLYIQLLRVIVLLMWDIVKQRIGGAKETWAVARVVYGRISCLSMGGLLKTDETGHACFSHSLRNVGGIVSFAVSPIRRRMRTHCLSKSRLIHCRIEVSCHLHSELAS